MKRASLVVVAVLLPTAAQAQQISCDEIAKSKVPYEIRFVKKSGTILTRQVYRSEKNYSTSYELQDGKSSKGLWQSNFLKQTSFSDGAIFYIEWENPVDKFSFDQGKVFNTKNKQRRGDAYVGENSGVMIVEGQDDIMVGACVYETVRYKSQGIGNSNGVEQRSDHTMWYSKALQTILKQKIHIERGSSAHEDTLEPQEITVKFSPIQ